MPDGALSSIPTFGPASIKDLNSLGIYTIADLKDKDPESLYVNLEKIYGCHIDRCVLYGFREAVYFAGGGRDPEKLKWWSWKDKDKNGIKNHLCEHKRSKS